MPPQIRRIGVKVARKPLKLFVEVQVLNPVPGQRRKHDRPSPVKWDEHAGERKDAIPKPLSQVGFWLKYDSVPVTYLEIGLTVGKDYRPPERIRPSRKAKKMKEAINLDDIIKMANEIIKEASEYDRKERAYRNFAMCYAISGMMMLGVKPEKRSEVLLDIFEVFREFLSEENYTIKAKPKEMETKFMLLHLKAILNPSISSDDEIDKQLRKDFEELFWNKCIFA